VQEQIERDLKTALLAGDKKKVETIRGLKSALQYEAVSSGTKDRTLTDEQIQKVLARESKKRQETADIYNKANELERAQKELDEKQLIDAYLPEPLSEEEIKAAVTEEISKFDSVQPSDMGKIIGAVKGKLGAQADGAIIAKLVKQRLGT
jgi:uncharacterized protein YqeY